VPRFTKDIYAVTGITWLDQDSNFSIDSNAKQGLFPRLLKISCKFSEIQVDETERFIGFY
jgi:hypothetical protein